MSEENIKKIGNYIFSSKDNGGIMPVCCAAEAPTVVVMSDFAQNLSLLPEKLKKMYVPHAVETASDGEIANAVGELIKYAGMFVNPGILNVCIICGTGDDLERNARVREVIKPYMDRFECVNITDIYSFNEMTEDKEKIKAHIEALTAYSVSETVIFLGAAHYDKRVDSEERLIRAHSDIAASVIAFKDKLNLGCGCFSFGMGYFSDYEEEYKVSILKKCYENRGADMHSPVSGAVEQAIDKLVRETYTQDVTCPFLSRILKNERITGAASAEECVKAVYGDAAEVYIENEERKYKKAVESVGESVALLVKNSEMSELREISERLVQKIEELKIRAEERSAFADGRTHSAEETLEAADRCIKAMAERLMNEYYIAIYSLCAEAIENECENREMRKKMRADELNAILMFINSMPIHGRGNIENIPFVPGIDVSETPIESICGAVNDLAEKKGTTAADYFAANKEEAFVTMKSLAEPYCRNKEDGRCFFIGSDDRVNFAEMGAAELSAGGEISDIRLLRCCRAVNINYYI